MSRQELAELVNTHLLKTAKLTTDLDGNYIGKLERGVHRWPSAGYRNAFRTVLNAATDADLGFYITGRSRTHPSDALFAATLPGESSASVVSSLSGLAAEPTVSVVK